jgi:hypothetical protein
MTDRTHWQLIAAIDPVTCKVVDAFIGCNHVLGFQNLKGQKHYGMVIALLTEIRTPSIMDSQEGLTALIKGRHSWVLDAFPESFAHLKDPYSA